LSRKFVFKIGSYIVRFRSKKVNALLYNLIYAASVEAALEKLDEKDLSRVRKLGYDSGVALIYDMADKVRQGLLGRNIDELIEQGKSAWYIYFGSKVETEVERKDNEVVVKIRDRECPSCMGRRYNGFYCEAMAAGHEGAQHAVVELLNLPVDVEVHETKCIARGDEYCEFTAIYRMKK